MNSNDLKNLVAKYDKELEVMKSYYNKLTNAKFGTLLYAVIYDLDSANSSVLQGGLRAPGDPIDDGILISSSGKIETEITNITSFVDKCIEAIQKKEELRESAYGMYKAKLQEEMADLNRI